MMKKVLLILLSALFTVNVTACKSNVTTSNKEESVTLTWYVPLSNQADSQHVLEKAAEITEPAIGAKLDIQFIDVSAFNTRMNMNMASGTPFDLTFTGYVNPYLTAARKGGLLEIGELIKKETPDLLKALPDYAWDAASINGKIYAVPNLQVFAPPNSLYVFKDLADKYLFDPAKIKHMSELEPYLAKIKANEPNIYPYRPVYGTMMWYGDKYEIIESGVAIRCDGSSPEVFFIYDTPEYKEAITTLHDWYQKGYIRADYLSAGDDSQDLKAGKYAVSQSGWAPGAEVSAKLSTGKDVLIVPMMKAYLNKTKCLATMIAVGANSKNSVKAVKMIELLNTNKDLYNLISYGIEGVHYTKDQEQKIDPIKDSGYMPNSAWMFGNQFNAYLQKGQEDNIWEETEKLNQEAVKSPVLGFVLDTEPIKNQISQIAAINAEYSESTFIVNGNENWDAYMSKLDQAGRHDVLAEVQKQVNEYWKTK